jgi:hypothetical protein
MLLEVNGFVDSMPTSLFRTLLVRAGFAYRENLIRAVSRPVKTIASGSEEP